MNWALIGPRPTFEDGLARTVKWYRENEPWWRPLKERRHLKVIEMPIPGLFVLESPVWSDERGFFREWYKREDLEASGVNFPIHQANLSMSKRGVVRGMHYSVAPEGQAKLVTCAYGELDDVIVDVRVGSPTFGRFEIVHLAASEERSVLLPAGAAHGFCVTSEIGILFVPAVVAVQRGNGARDQPL